MDNFRLAEMALINLIGDIYQDKTYEEIRAVAKEKLHGIIKELGERWNKE